jgi:alpha-tubulin suppressor-like RCC1 family protein
MKLSPRVGLFLVGSLVSIGLVACSDRMPTPPQISVSNTSNGSVTVTSAAPNSAPQDTTLDVHVFGTGYDRGSSAQWAQGGVPSPNVKTNSTKFVSSGELVANITIALAASQGSYDILVTTAQGKKGIGTELFTITLKHNAVATVTVTPASNTIAVGASVPLKATAYNSTGTVLTTATFSWSTSNAAVALVSASGLMTTVGQGSATITATSGGVSGNSTVTTLASLTFVDVRAGVHYSCGRVAGGAAICWGANDMYQLGNGSTTDVYGPSAVSGGHLFATLSVQYSGGCGLETSGSAWCWGGVGEPTTSGGALGGGNANAPVPVALVGGLSFATVSEGDATGCGLDAGGVAYCWGWNRYGQLGNGTSADSPTPVAVSGGLTYSAISVGASDHTCALTTAGAAYCWGLNGSGQLGGSSTDVCTTPLGASIPCSLRPIAVSGGLVFTTISAGWSNTCGITTGGAAYCWGSNAYGRLGNGTTTDAATPVPVSGGLSFSAISATQSTCGLTTSGAAYCWGFNKWGQLGNGTTNNSSIPVPVSGGLTFAGLSSGGQHSCGLTTANVTYCWGFNSRGQLGDGTQTDRWVPVKVVGQP